jgi:hypothetical protein
MAFKIPQQAPLALEQGQWTSYEGSDFRIAYASNVRFLRVKQRLEQPHRRKIENNSLDPMEHRRILCKAMAEAILLDWKNLDGDVEYSTKAAEQALLADEAFREFVMTFSMELANFRDEELATEGNS